MPGVFISYRRGDADEYARRVYDALCREIGADHVFMDLDARVIGRDYLEVVEDALDETAVMLAIIGERWLVGNGAGQACRIDDPDDSARAEVVGALARRTVRVIPVLVNNASMPTVDQLPEPLKGLARRREVTLRKRSWQDDVAQLTGAVRRILDDTQDRASGPDDPPARSQARAWTPSEHDRGRAVVDIRPPVEFGLVGLKHRDLALVTDTERRALVVDTGRQDAVVARPDADEAVDTENVDAERVEAELRELRAIAEAEARAILDDARQQAVSIIADAEARAAQIIAAAQAQPASPPAMAVPVGAGQLLPGRPPPPPSGVPRPPAKGQTATQTIVIRSVPNFPAALALEGALRAIDGVKRVRVANFNDRSLSFQVTHILGDTLVPALLGKHGGMLRLVSTNWDRTEMTFAS